MVLKLSHEMAQIEQQLKTRVRRYCCETLNVVHLIVCHWITIWHKQPNVLQPMKG